MRKLLVQSLADESRRYVGLSDSVAGLAIGNMEQVSKGRHGRYFLIRGHITSGRHHFTHCDALHKHSPPSQSASIAYFWSLFSFYWLEGTSLLARNRRRSRARTCGVNTAIWIIDLGPACWIVREHGPTFEKKYIIKRASLADAVHHHLQALRVQHVGHCVDPIVRLIHLRTKLTFGRSSVRRLRVTLKRLSSAGYLTRHICTFIELKKRAPSLNRSEDDVWIDETDSISFLW